MNVDAFCLTHESVDLIREGYSEDLFAGTRVSGKETMELVLETCYFVTSIAFVSRKILSYD
jgi:hypothetical protein